jgi:hypothetical protein
MPFWSKKGKERAVDPEGSSFRVLGQVQPTPDNETFIERTQRYRQHGIHLPDSYRAKYEERWEAETTRRRDVGLNIKELYGKCTPEYNAAEEAAIEVRMLTYSCACR